ncbi:MAG: hypothetical protein JST79_03590 [Acidobacteria bacterium]|nr:hypothetical protein [Acidobacteriota bacterium]
MTGRKAVHLTFLALMAMGLASCSLPGGGTTGSSNSNASTSSKAASVTLTVAPANATVTSGQKQQFTAKVTGVSNTAVTWVADKGSINASGVYTAPQVSSTTSVVVVATSKADPQKVSWVRLTVAPKTTTVENATLAVSTKTLPAATSNKPYSAALAAAGGTSPYTWSVTSGTLPSGLQVSGSGAISGTPTQTGSFSFNARVTDAAAKSSTQTLTLTVAAAPPSSPPSGSTDFDGPAELPRAYVSSALADTPAPGKTIAVSAGGNLQNALNSASCGDTIALQAGATFNGSFTVPAKSCDDNHWIIVRTSAPDSSLPPEGTRLTPCYAGVSSLPGRPALNCKSTAVVTAKLSSTLTNGVFTFATGANHYRFVGLEITRPAASSSLPIVYQLAQAYNTTAHHLVFDRVWMHGNAQDDTGHGIQLNGMSHVAVVDSYLNDFHCVSSTGSCTDSQAIVGGNSDYADGPFKIVNNFLEAAAQSIMFGGGSGSTVPADIEIRRNHLFKPLTWQKGRSGYVGGTNGNPFIVKNHFELKNGQRILFEGNILENSWGGFSQVGWGIVLTPRGSWAAVQDITIRYNTVSHVGAGMQLAATQNGENGVSVDSLAAQRWSIHDVVLDDVSASTYSGSGNLIQISSAMTTRTLNNLTIDHVTGITDPQHGVLIVGSAAANPTPSNIALTNNLFLAGTYSVWPSGVTNPCSASLQPMLLFNACWNPYVFTNNAFILPSVQANSSWPAGNYLPANVAAVQFTNYNNGKGGDYTLLSSSPYKNAGSDGADLGANISAIQQAIAGVK